MDFNAIKAAVASAAEKAGIIKDNAPVLYGGTDNSAAKIIEDTAIARGSAFSRVDYTRLENINMSLDGTRFDFDGYRDLEIKLLGSYQPRNASVVISAIEILRNNGFTISDDDIKNGLRKAVWHGRFEIISNDPLIIFDGAHNPQGIASAVESVKTYFGDKKIYLLTGGLRDKDYSSIATDLEKIASKAFTLTPDNPRALSASEYALVLNEKGIEATSFCSLNEALCAAKNAAKNDGVPIVCLGSLYVYSSLIELL